MEGEESLRYDKLESWCKASILNGEDFLFDEQKFRSVLITKSDEYDFPVEVCTSFSFISCVRLLVWLTWFSLYFQPLRKKKVAAITA